MTPKSLSNKGWVYAWPDEVMLIEAARLAPVSIPMAIREEPKPEGRVERLLDPELRSSSSELLRSMKSGRVLARPSELRRRGCAPAHVVPYDRGERGTLSKD